MRDSTQIHCIHKIYGWVGTYCHPVFSFEQKTLWTCDMKLKELESYLQGLEVFKSPKVKLEQYPTSPHIAARMLHTIDTRYKDLDGCTVADLGCGCGVLAIGASLLGASMCFGIDIDKDALDISYQNYCEYELKNLELIQMDVTKMPGTQWNQLFDTVIMNPPFGTKQNRGIDMLFLKTGLNMATRAVYSLHKTATREHIRKKTKEWGVNMEVISELRFDLLSSYKFHKHQSVDIQVDFIRFSFPSSHLPISRTEKNNLLWKK
ncbi:methyltransferase like 5 isoform X2 [Tachypleus tridentatus]|uniref:methyltransferase like 5 isoform X2 n=1 Tax=Tachypleus tridentatus TaxID=6853 RepID=UPI003FD3A9D0